MNVRLIAYTTALADAMIQESGGMWEPEEMYDDSSALSEFAGRQCYESWGRPNPATATNAGYLANIMHQRHTSVLEHGVATLRISEVSRSLTHELVRHRHFSYSQLSQRFVTLDPEGFVVPPLYREGWSDDPGEPTGESQAILQRVWEQAVKDYDELVGIWMPRLIQRGVDAHRARKMAREAARSVLPNMTPTAIVMTGNHLAWRQMLAKRGTIDADAEIRETAIAVYRVLADLEPNLYQDFSVQSVSSPHSVISVEVLTYAANS